MYRTISLEIKKSPQIESSFSFYQLKPGIIKTKPKLYNITTNFSHITQIKDFSTAQLEKMG